MTTNNIIRKAKKGADLIIKGQTSTFLDILRRCLYSNKQSFGLMRDMSKPFINPKAKIEIEVRKLQDQDISYLLSTEGLTEAEARLIDVQRDLVNSNFKNCYVAVTKDDTPCYMQWIMEPSDNKNIKGYFGQLFPELKHNEALLEGAFMHHAFRGKRVMPEAMCQIAEKASETGANIVITFVDINNIASLKGCKSCGFTPYILRKEKWFLFKHYVTFVTIPENILLKYHDAVAN